MLQPNHYPDLLTELTTDIESFNSSLQNYLHVKDVIAIDQWRESISDCCASMRRIIDNLDLLIFLIYQIEDADPDESILAWETGSVRDLGEILFDDSPVSPDTINKWYDEHNTYLDGRHVQKSQYMRFCAEYFSNLNDIRQLNQLYSKLNAPVHGVQHDSREEANQRYTNIFIQCRRLVESVIRSNATVANRLNFKRDILAKGANPVETDRLVEAASFPEIPVESTEYLDLRDQILHPEKISILVLPTDGVLSIDDMRLLLKLPWSLVISLNTNPAFEMRNIVDPSEQSRYSELLDNNPANVSDGHNKVSWVTIADALPFKMNKQVKGIVEHFLSNNKGVTTTVVVASGDKVNKMKYIVSGIMETLADNGNAIYLADLYTGRVGNNPTWENEKSGWLETFNDDSDPQSQLLTIKAIPSSAIYEGLVADSSLGSYRNTDARSSALWNKYFTERPADYFVSEESLAASGIELVKILDPETYAKRQLSRKWTFYEGDTITWNELAQEMRPDIGRTQYDNIKSKARELVNRPSIKELLILSDPCSGASTLIRRLAFDLNQELSENPVILINSRFSITDTIIKLNKLASWPGFPNTRSLIVLIDDKENDRETFRLIREAFVDTQRNALIIHNQSNRQENEVNARGIERVTLSARLDFAEKTNFRNLYQLLLADNTRLSEAQKAEVKERWLNSDSQLISFPMGLLEGVADNDLFNSYARQHLSRATGDIVRFIGYTAFISRYRSGSRFVEPTLLRGACPINPEQSTDLNRFVMDRLLLKERAGEKYTGNRRPLFSPLANSIVREAFPGHNDGQVALNYLDTLEGQYLDSEDLFTIGSMFITVDESADSDEYTGRPVRGAARHKYRPLIASLLEEGRADQIDAIFKKLIKLFPDNPHYKAHYARYKYNTAHSHNADINDRLFSEAGALLNEAIESEEGKESQHIHHMMAVYQRRRMHALFHHKRAEAPDEAAFKKIVEMAILSIQTIDKAIALNTRISSAIFLFFDKANTAKTALEFARHFRGGGSYRECIDSSPQLQAIEDIFIDTLSEIESIDSRLTSNYAVAYSELSDFNANLDGNLDATIAILKERIRTENRPLQRDNLRKRLVRALLRQASVAASKSANQYIASSTQEMRINRYRAINNDQTLSKDFRAYLSPEMKGVTMELDYYKHYFFTMLYGNPTTAPLTPEEAINILSQWKDALDRDGETTKAKQLELLSVLYFRAVAFSLQALNCRLSQDKASVSRAEADFAACNRLYCEINGINPDERYSRDIRTRHFLGLIQGHDNSELIMQNIVQPDPLYVTAKLCDVAPNGRGKMEFPCGLKTDTSGTLFIGDDDRGRWYRGRLSFRNSGLLLDQYRETDSP